MRQEIDVLIGLAVLLAGVVCMIVGGGLMWMGLMALFDG